MSGIFWETEVEVTMGELTCDGCKDAISSDNPDKNKAYLSQGEKTSVACWECAED